MKALYVTAVVTYSGKTALALGIGLKLQSMGRKVGYMKPLSTQPFLLGGKLVDEDAEFVGRTLGLELPTEALSPIILDDAKIDAVLGGAPAEDYLAAMRSAYATAAEGRDVLLLEGGASMREGYLIGLNAIRIAETLDAPTLGVVRFRSTLMLVDDALALKSRMGDRLLGIVVNSVPDDQLEAVRGKVSAFLEGKGVRVYGVLPSDPRLMSISVSELTAVLEAKKLTPEVSDDGLIETLSVGAMSVEAATQHFRRLQRKAVITGGDRADIQAAALETSTTALVLTGNLQPSSTILKHAESRGVAVLLVPYNTLEAIERVEKVFGKTRLAHPEKLARFRESLDVNLNWARLFADMGV
jgi:BioD-like phosphotransacetylase family protein